MKFVVYSLGCKVNQYEGLSVIRKLREAGFAATEKLEKADVYVLNSCSVTGEADAKSRRLIARFARLNPDADILVMGCSAQIHAASYAQNPKVYAVSGTADKLGFIDRYLDKQPSSQKPEPEFSLPADYEEYPFPCKTRTRAYIKIQDGCDNFCSYCIVPYARGRSRSRTLADVYREIDATESREIVFTGINLSDYAYGIPALIRGLDRYPDKRFRLSSLEPNLITSELLTVWQDSPVCGHFHLSMQSGSDAVLRAMNRRYTAARFLDDVDLIRRYFPDAGITTDVIAGFPGETEQNHAETVRTIRTAAFSDMHVFPYSERAGTKAAVLPQLPMDVRRRRAAELSAVRDEMKADFLTRRQGKTYTILGESGNSGFTANYIKVYAAAPEGEYAAVTLGERYQDGVRGEAVKNT